jgi:hypothetical protein
MFAHEIEKLVHSFQRTLLVAGDDIVDKLHKHHTSAVLQGSSTPGVEQHNSVRMHHD